MTPACRSYLFVPGHRPDRFAKAAASGADAVVLDLEDAVPPDRKVEARGHVADFLRAAPAAVVRVNGPGTEWFAQDLAMCREHRVAAVMVPKAERPEELTWAQEATQAVLLPLVETARGVARARHLAAVRNVQRLVFGSVDLQLDLGVDDDEALRPAAFELVLASRLAGLLAPVDGVCVALKDAERVQREAARGRSLGFGAKLCIHPEQVGPVHRAFTPSEPELDWARAVVSACEAGAGAAVQVDGQMVDWPVLQRARRLLASVAGLRPVSALPAGPLAWSQP